MPITRSAKNNFEIESRFSKNRDSRKKFMQTNNECEIELQEAHNWLSKYLQTDIRVNNNYRYVAA
jgi:hypothetical protein